MAIGLQKLSAGSGYEHRTRQVAAMDATGLGHTTLSDVHRSTFARPVMCGFPALEVRPGRGHGARHRQRLGVG